MGVYVPAICGGRGSCGKCRVKVLDGFLEKSESDGRFLSPEETEDGWRLACAASPSQDLSIDVEPRNEENISIVTECAVSFYGAPSAITTEVRLSKSGRSVTDRIREDKDDGPVSIETLRGCSELVERGFEAAYVARSGGKIISVSGTRRDLYGITIDIGTTTLCFALVNISDGTVKGYLSMINRQREYGADVISRIQRAANGELGALSGVIQGQISQGAKRLCEKYCIDPGCVARIAIAGNTAMLHLLLGLSCKTIGVYPFTPVTLDLIRIRYGDVFKGDFSCAVDILPGLSTYVGADIASGILFVNLLESKEPAFLLDMGTNGEMAVSRDGRLYCTSTAAGPAFEGGNILWGTGSVPGAISSARFEDGGWNVSTIDDKPPCGICGSGVIDVVAECLVHGAIAGSGRFEKDYKGGIALGETESGEKILFTQKDIREVQLGKSAVRSGIDLLLREAGLSYDEIGTFYIAGGFGYRINFERGAAIGLFPKELAGKASAVGNSALGGLVKYMLDEKAAESLGVIARSSIEFNLSQDKEFNQMFINNMSF
jgi:uncharacterized 2Fe-2S/4Fe-4S cluster protein (DUF4445 family)